MRGQVQALDAVGQRLLAAPDSGEALLEFLTEAADQRARAAGAADLSSVRGVAVVSAGYSPSGR